MDLFDFDNIKTEKTNAMRKYHRLRKIANMFRFIEIVLVMIFISWCSNHLPDLLKISGEYFNYLSVFVLSPGFVFLLGNFIILTLFIKSGQFLQQPTNFNGSGTDFYDEFVKNSENSLKIETGEVASLSKTEEEVVSLSKTEEVFYQDKETVYEEIPINSKTTKDLKIFGRSQSEILNHEMSDKTIEKKLRRAETEKCRKVENIQGKLTKEEKLEDEMSDDELNKKIEAFIEKQMKFHREESMAIVLQNKKNN